MRLFPRQRTRELKLLMRDLPAAAIAVLISLVYHCSSSDDVSLSFPRVAVASTGTGTATRTDGDSLLDRNGVAEEGYSSLSEDTTSSRERWVPHSGDDDRATTVTVKDGQNFLSSPRHFPSLLDVDSLETVTNKQRRNQGRRQLRHRVYRSSWTPRRPPQADYGSRNGLPFFSRNVQRIRVPRERVASGGRPKFTRRRTRTGGRTREGGHREDMTSSKLFLFKMALLGIVTAVVSTAAPVLFGGKTPSLFPVLASGEESGAGADKGKDSPLGESLSASPSSSQKNRETPTMSSVLSLGFLTAGFTVLAMVASNTGITGAENAWLFMQNVAVTLAQDQHAYFNPAAFLLSAFISFGVLGFAIAPSAGLLGVVSWTIGMTSYAAVRAALRIVLGMAGVGDMSLFLPVWFIGSAILVVFALRSGRWPWRAMEEATEEASASAKMLAKQRGRDEESESLGVEGESRAGDGSFRP